MVYQLMFVNTATDSVYPFDRNNVTLFTTNVFR